MLFNNANIILIEQWNRRPLGLKSSTLSLSHCASFNNMEFNLLPHHFIEIIQILKYFPKNIFYISIVLKILWKMEHAPFWNMLHFYAPAMTMARAVSVTPVCL